MRMFSFIFQAGVLILIDKYIVCVAEMFNTGSRVCFFFFSSYRLAAMYGLRKPIVQFTVM